MARSGHELPTLAEISRDGWSIIYDHYHDSWNSGDRTHGKISAGVFNIEFIRLARTSHDSKAIIINHGGPLGSINEGWRYLFDCKNYNIIMPRQYDSDSLHKSPDTAILRSGGLTQICEHIYILQKSISPGKVVLTGTSWGATVSLAYAALYPDLVSGLVISTPFIPTRRSLDHLVSKDGGFYKNKSLWEYFMDGIDVNETADAADIFGAYYTCLRKTRRNTNTIRHFSSLFYSVMGDCGYDISSDQLPEDGLGYDRAIGFSYLASLPKPFQLDEGHFIKGLRLLRARKVPIYIVACTEDRSSSEYDLNMLKDNSGAEIRKVLGGHSAPAAKKRLRDIVEKL